MAIIYGIKEEFFMKPLYRLSNQQILNEYATFLKLEVITDDEDPQMRENFECEILRRMEGNA